MRACVHACMHACMDAWMHACMYACMHVCMYACMNVCMYACMHVCMCMCACMYACACMRVHVSRPSRNRTTSPPSSSSHFSSRQPSRRVHLGVGCTEVSPPRTSRVGRRNAAVSVSHAERRLGVARLLDRLRIRLPLMQVRISVCQLARIAVRSRWVFRVEEFA